MENTFASFVESPGLRIVLALVFWGLFGFWFFRRFAGRGKIVFVAVSLLLALLFYLSPAIQWIAFVPLLALLALSLWSSAPIRPGYLPAEALVEGGGLKRGLTTPEAAVIMEKPLNQILGVVMLALLRKGVLIVERQSPLTLSLTPEYLEDREADSQMREDLLRQTAQINSLILHPYDDPFIEQIGASHGAPLGEVNFTAPARALLRYTARRVRGHNLTETRTYYQKHLGRARHDVELQKNERVQDHYFEWLALDRDFADLYQDYIPAWLPEGNNYGSGELVEWVEGLIQALSTSIPPEGLQIKTSQGGFLAIGGRDPVSPEFFDQVLREL